MVYRCIASSPQGFLQQLAASYLAKGYWFYTQGFIPADKDAKQVDQKLIEKYEIDVSRQTRARRKLVGHANLHYLRYRQHFILVATQGAHYYFEEEANNIRDVRRVPIKFELYSISVQRGQYLRQLSDEAPPQRDGQWRVRVQIKREYYEMMKSYLVHEATRHATDRMIELFNRFDYEPYAPVRQQLFNLLRLVNNARGQVGMEPLPSSIIRCRRRIVMPFDSGEYEV